MKTTIAKPFFLVILAALLLSACASSQPAATTVSLLGAAGFRLRTPETPKQKEIFASLPSYKVESLVVNGHKFYVYKDESKGLALVGHQVEYDRYRQMARQEQASAGYHNAIMASEAEAQSWYGAGSSDWWR